MFMAHVSPLNAYQIVLGRNQIDKKIQNTKVLLTRANTEYLMFILIE